MRTVQEFVKTGVAGIHLEDQRFPKRCGHIAGKTIVSREEALGKYRAAVDTRNRLDPDFVLIARTDAYGAVGGSMEEAIWRGRAYADAGVDLVWAELSNASREPAIEFAKAMRQDASEPAAGVQLLVVVPLAPGPEPAHCSGSSATSATSSSSSRSTPPTRGPTRRGTRWRSWCKNQEQAQWRSRRRRPGIRPRATT